MPEEMPSWRSLASVASRTIKGYVVQHDPRKVIVVRTEDTLPNGQSVSTYTKQSWGQWAGQKIRDLRLPNEESTASAIEKLSLFPGWATRRYRDPNPQDLENAEFNVEVFVSGYASRFSGPGFGTRSGRAFLRIAKSYAALPKLVNGVPMVIEGNEVDENLTNTADQLLASKHLPARPDDIAEDGEVQALEEKLRQLDYESDGERAASASSASSHHSSNSSSPTQSQSSQSETPPSQHPGANLLQKWHSNLEQRLYPFWASSLSNRTLRISVYSSDPTLYDVASPPLHAPDEDNEDLHKRPIATKEVTTSTDGSFQAKFRLEWETLCQHPGALHIAFGDAGLEHELFVSTQLMPAPSRPSTPTSIGPASAQYFTRPPRIVKPTVTATLSVPLTHTSVRVISDIDDTVKLSGILQGARAAFRNVFVKDLRESVIPGMADWYLSMWKRGVRFHYVSNGPFELLPVVSEFIQLSRLPPGSVKLKSYAGRSLFNGILSAPAERKRAGIQDVLDSFPDSKFILVGDSGEQDLELYATLAKDRPTQILAVFIRDANNSDVVNALDDPTGEEVLRCSDDEVPFILGSSSSRNPLSIIVPRSNSATSTPSSSPKPGDLNFTPRRVPSKSISEMPTPRPNAVPRFIAPLRRASRTYSGQISPSEASPFSLKSSGGSSSSSSSGSSEQSGTLIPPYPQPSPSIESHSSSLVDSPISEEPAPFLTPTPSRPIPVPIQSSRPQSYFARPPSRTPSRSSTIGSMISGQPTMTDAERRQFDLQTRVYRARLDMPRHVPLRVFRSPAECVEAGKTLDKLHFGIGPEQPAEASARDA